MAAQTPEGRVKDEIKKVLVRHSIWYYMPVQTGWGVAGIPDFVCCWGGDFLGIEAKAPGKKGSLTVHQERIGEKIQQAGGLYVVVDDAAYLEDWLHARQEEINQPEVET